MPNFFSPPLGPGRPYALRRDRPYSSLFRFYGTIPTGINIWIIDGVVTTVEPDRSVVTPDHEFLGSHIYEVDDDVAALLTAAGYELLAYTPPTPSVPLPGNDYGSDYRTRYGSGLYGSGLYA